MILAGTGLSLTRQEATNTCETSHGKTLGGQSRGTGTGGGGLAQAWTRIVMETGGARALTGTRNALGCGVPPGPHAMAGSMVIRVAQVQAEIPGLRGAGSLVIRIAQDQAEIPGLREMTENKEIPGDQVLAENMVIRVARGFYDLLVDRVRHRLGRRHRQRPGRRRLQDRRGSRRTKGVRGPLRSSMSRSSQANLGATWMLAPQQEAT